MRERESIRDNEDHSWIGALAIGEIPLFGETSTASQRLYISSAVDQVVDATWEGRHP